MEVISTILQHGVIIRWLVYINQSPVILLGRESHLELDLVSQRLKLYKVLFEVATLSLLLFQFSEGFFSPILKDFLRISKCQNVAWENFQQVVSFFLFSEVHAVLHSLCYIPIGFLDPMTTASSSIPVITTTGGGSSIKNISKYTLLVLYYIM